MASDERVQVGLEELQDLKGVWSELAKVWEKVDELKEKPWLSVQPRKVSALFLVKCHSDANRGVTKNNVIKCIIHCA